MSSSGSTAPDQALNRRIEHTVDHGAEAVLVVDDCDRRGVTGGGQELGSARGTTVARWLR